MLKVKIVLIGLLVIAACQRLTDEELWTKGVEAQKSENFDESLHQYETLTKEYPKSPKVPDALYAMGSICQNNKRDLNGAIRLYRQIVQEYPTHPTASGASFLIGFIYNNELKNLDSARIAYNEFLQKYPDNPMVASAKFELDNLGKDPAEIVKANTDSRQSASKDKKSQTDKKK
jgi:TolA-binding protein